MRLPEHPANVEALERATHLAARGVRLRGLAGILATVESLRLVWAFFEESEREEHRKWLRELVKVQRRLGLAYRAMCGLCIGMVVGAVFGFLVFGSVPSPWNLPMYILVLMSFLVMSRWQRRHGFDPAILEDELRRLG